MVWFENELGRSWWACNTPIETHQNERDLEAVQVWNCTVEDDLKELIGTTHTNKMHVFFSRSSLKNYIVKHVWFQAIIGWLSFYKFPKKHVNEDKAH